jgi:hypothetical protein
MWNLIRFFIYIMKSSDYLLVKEIVGSCAFSVGPCRSCNRFALLLLLIHAIQKVLHILLIFERVAKHVEI